jgi:serine/threonine protein kinase/tetratricopeptide (TPR) repeat protein
MNLEDLQQRLQGAVGDRYRVLESVGAGGMAFVFRALDLKHQRPVALKVLRPEVAEGIGAQRFLQEIRIAANLTHPNTLPLHDSGEADGLLYYVMPFVEGESLRDRLTDLGRLPLDEAGRYVSQVAQGLAQAHQAGIIHRDVKPENILLVGGVAVLADFGIARAVDAAGHSNLTKAGSTPSTPRYASPEQVWEEDAVGAPSDQYSLACVAFEMIAGAPPFHGQSDLAVATKHATADVPDLSTLREGVPPAVARVIRRALSKDPQDRYPGITAFSEDLERALRGATISDRVERSKPTRRRKGWAFLAALPMIALAGWGLLQIRPSSSEANGEGPPVLAVLPFTHVGAPESEYLTLGLSDEVSVRLGTLEGLDVVARTSASGFEPGTQSVVDFARDLGATHVLAGAVRVEAAEAGPGQIRFTPRLIRVHDGEEIWQGQRDADLEVGAVLALQEQIADEVARSIGVNLASAGSGRAGTRTESLEAYESFVKGRPLASQLLVESSMREAIRLFRRAIEEDPGFFEAHAQLAEALSVYYFFHQRMPSVLGEAREAAARAEALAPDRAETLVARGYLEYWGDQDYEEALDLFDAAGAAFSSDPELLWVVGSVQRRQGDMETALESFRRGFRLDPRSYLLAFEVAGTHFMLGRITEGLPFADRARDLSPNWPPASLARTVLLLGGGQIEEARDYMASEASSPEFVTAALPGLASEIIYRPFWFLVLGDPYIEALASSTPELVPDPVSWYLLKARLSFWEGDDASQEAFADSAVAALQRRAADHGQGGISEWARIDLGWALTLAGMEVEARQALTSVDAATLIQADHFRGPFWALELARVLTVLGDIDAALDVLQVTTGVPGPGSLPLVHVDPDLEPLRSNPRWSQIVASIPLPS